MPGAVGLIDGEPLLVASAGTSVGRLLHPSLAAVCRAPQVVAEKGKVNVRLKTEPEKLPDLIGVRDRVAAEDIILQNPGKRPVRAAIACISPATLPEIRCNVVELSPGNRHLVAVCRINGNCALVRGIAEDVLPICIDVHLKARK